jgi:hypothetical protein
VGEIWVNPEQKPSPVVIRGMIEQKQPDIEKKTHNTPSTSTIFDG